MKEEEEEILEQVENRVLEEIRIHEQRGLQGAAEARVQVPPSLESREEEAERQGEEVEQGLMCCDEVQEVGVIEPRRPEDYF